MNAAQPQANSAPAPVISWWLSAVLGIAVGVTVSLIRTERYFFIFGAIILALVILVLGLLTIRRRRLYPQLMESRVSVGYVLYSALIIFMVGPVQVIFPAEDVGDLWIKSIVLSAGFTVAIRGADYGLVRAERTRRRS